MAITKGVDSYATLAEADVRVALNPRHVAAWSALSDADQEAYLKLATQILDDHFIWDGYVVQENQDREWPRDGVVNRRGYLIPRTTTPEEIGWAAIETARQMAEKDRTKDDAIETIGLASASGASFTGDGGHKVIPDSAWYLIPDSFWIEVRHRPKTSQMARMVSGIRG